MTGVTGSSVSLQLLTLALLGMTDARAGGLGFLGSSLVRGRGRGGGLQGGGGGHEGDVCVELAPPGPCDGPQQLLLEQGDQIRGGGTAGRRGGDHLVFLPRRGGVGDGYGLGGRTAD